MYYVPRSIAVWSLKMLETRAISEKKGIKVPSKRNQ